MAGVVSQAAAGALPYAVTLDEPVLARSSPPD